MPASHRTTRLQTGAIAAAHRPSAHVSTRIDRNDARRILLHMTASWTKRQVNLNETVITLLFFHYISYS